MMSADPFGFQKMNKNYSSGMRNGLFGQQSYGFRLANIMGSCIVGIMVRFDKPCVLVSGAVEYFREHMAVGDYLTQEGQAEMTWVGAGAERLGLAGICELDQFEHLCRGLHPLTGERLLVRDKGPARRVCYFGQISPPKDVSLLCLVGGDRRIGQWWEEAVRETLREIEAVTATRVRRAGANEDRVTGTMVTAIVTHDASRSLDPQLHTHLCIMNVTFDGTENRWKSVQPSAYFRHQGYFREVCYNRLAGRMREAGYELESLRGIGFNVKGVPAELRERFSKRRRAILVRAGVLGAKTQEALQTIAGESRQEKSHATAKELRAGWLAEAGEGLATLRKMIGGASAKRAPGETVSSSDVLRSAEAHVFERCSVVEDRVLLREALVAGRGQVVLAEVKAALAGRCGTGDLVRAGSEVASREGLAAEEEFIGWAGRHREGGRWGKAVASAGLGADQAAAVRGVLEATSQVVILQGDAGTGKTTCLKSIVAGIEQAGGRVFGCAPSAGAADVLRHELTADADTLQQLLVNEALQRATRGRVLLVDEAGLVSVREMRDLCRVAATNGNRLLLVGDIKQHHSVEAGDALRCLQQFARVPAFRLTEIRRQQDPAYRKAVGMLAGGQAFEAFCQFARLGAVKEIKEQAAMFEAAAADYVKTIRAGQTCLAISPVWSEIHSFTDHVRGHLKGAGLVGRDDRTVLTVFPLKWTREERRRLANYQAGDVLTFHRESDVFVKHETVTVVRRDPEGLVVRTAESTEHLFDPRRTGGFEVGVAKEIPVAVGDRLLVRTNLKMQGLRNGDLVEVTGFAADGAIRLKDGGSLPAWFRHFTHGYATTSHAAQGKTIDRGLVIMADAGLDAGNLKQAYVSNSRFRLSQAIYTTDRCAARAAMMRAEDRKLALELDLPAPSTRPPSFRERIFRRPAAKMAV